MGLVLKYVVRTKAGGWQYRRRVPAEVGSTIKKREFKQFLGHTEREALAAWPRYNGQVEREIALARRELARRSGTGPMTEREAYGEAARRVAELVDTGTPEDLLHVVADAIVERHRANPETGAPLGMSSTDTHLVNLLRNREAPSLPLR